MTISPGRTLGVGLLLCLAASACLAQQVTFISPQNGATVRGIVDLHATKPNPADGWISYKVAKAGQEGNYIAAVISPFDFKWDTRQYNSAGTHAYTDGDYTVTATAFDASGNQVGEATVTVTVQNELTPAEVQQPLTLKVAYERASTLNFGADGKLVVTLPDSEKRKLGDWPLHLDIVVKADWTDTVLSASAEESVIDEKLKTGYLQVAGSQGYELPGAGKTFREKVLSDGTVGPLRKKDDHFALGEYYVELPDHPVSKGDTWTSELSVLPLPNAVSRQILSAQNRLDGFEWVAGRKCVRIITTFGQKNTLVMVRVGDTTVPIKTSYDARRASYFGLTDHHFVGFEEQMRHTVELPVSYIQMLFEMQLGQQAKSGGTGMPGAGGMMGPGMSGPGMMGGMMGSPTMAGGMMGSRPGMMGPGMMGSGMMGSSPGMMGPGMMGGGGRMGMGTGMGATGMSGGMGMPGMGGGMMGGGMMGGMSGQEETAKINIDSRLQIMEASPTSGAKAK